MVDPDQIEGAQASTSLVPLHGDQVSWTVGEGASHPAAAAAGDVAQNVQAEIKAKAFLNQLLSEQSEAQQRVEALTKQIGEADHDFAQKAAKTEQSIAVLQEARAASGLPQKPPAA